ncbi:winged helix-turn-helix transcriptional regulator [Cellulomonas hominis]|uniref:Winged helix-turn-helix transcriptional regulator n=1 Tax=Cellulomonas hominis TaxID=156981 RepID=A0A7Z8NRI7_9CELL|nr:winged helix-turn-helix domain-containing protein [Cellulomonas hominis]TKR27495.1 winged helix-turn-helix transcriptional regulator [Cellulomonas hominis]
MAIGDDSGLDDGRVLVRGDLVVEVPARCVRVADRQVPLTRSEFEILVALAERAGQPVSKDELAVAVAVHGPHAVPTPTDADRRSIEVHMANLRRKLAEGSGDRTAISTVRGLGYRLAPEVRVPDQRDGTTG